MEVGVFFLAPLFQCLGYAEPDFHYEYPVDIPEKFRSLIEKDAKSKRVDLILYDGTDRSSENVLVVVEAKRPDYDHPEKNEELLQKADNDTKLYSMIIGSACRRVATNGHELLIYTLPEGNTQSRVFKVHRSELKNRWHALYLILGKPMLLVEKKSSLG